MNTNNNWGGLGKGTGALNIGPGLGNGLGSGLGSGLGLNGM